MPAGEITGVTLSIDADRLIDRICDQFERDQKQGLRPQIEEILANAPAELRPKLVEELVLQDDDYRRQRGERVPAQDYIERFPELPVDVVEQIMRLGESVVVVTLPVSPADYFLGKVCGDYELLERIASGGMGVVYKARQISLNRLVAVKMILSGKLASPAEVKRFHSEAASAAQLDHPNIVSIYEVGNHDGQHFFSMALVEGASLEALLKAGPMHPRKAAEIVRETALAIEYAHSQGVIHRDLKPSNILVDKANRPRVTDFGLAKCIRTATDLTVTGDVLGTPNYMPPEQAAGNLAAVGPAADIYSLGAVLYALLTGRPPFQAASTDATLRQVVDQEPVRLRQLNAALPRDLETIVLRCLEKKPELRFARALDLAAELERFLDGRPIFTRPISLPARIVRWSRRQPLVAALSLVATLAVVIGTFASLVFGIQASLSEWAVRRSLYRSLIVQADLEWQVNNLERSEQVLDFCEPVLRNWEWRFLKQRCHLERIQFQGADDRVRQIVFSPHGDRLISAGIQKLDDSGTVRLWDVSTGRELHSWPFSSSVMTVAWSPDGERIATGLKDGRVAVWRIDDRRQVLPVKPHSGAVYRVEFAPNSRALATCGEDGVVKLLDAMNGNELIQLESSSNKSAPLLCVAFDLAGARLAAAGECGSIGIWDTVTGKRLHTIQTGPVLTRGLAFTADSRRIISADNDSNNSIRVWDIATAEVLSSFGGHQAAIRSIAMSSDGSLVASGDYAGNLTAWNVQNGTVVRTWKAHNRLVDSVAFRPHSREIATCGLYPLIRVWDLDSPVDTSRSSSSGDAVNEIAFVADSQFVASAHDDGVIRFWDAQLTEVRSMATHHQGRALAARIEPNGKWIVSAGEDGQVLFHNAGTGQLLDRINVGQEILWSVDIHPQGDRVVFGGDAGSFSIWNVETKKYVETRVHHSSGIACVRFSPDGERIASCGGDGKVQIWQIGSKQPLQVLEHQVGKIWNVAFSRDGRRLASAGSDGNVVLWNVATGQQEKLLTGHLGVVYAVSFSPDGSRLVTGGLDQSVKIWDPGSGLELLSLRDPSWSVNSVSFSPDGQSIAAGSSDEFVYLWRSDRLPHLPSHPHRSRE